MKKSDRDAYSRLSPAMKRLLVHCAETGGYMPGVDPIAIHSITVNAAAKIGFVNVDANGTCVLTDEGRALVAWALPRLPKATP